MAHGARSKRGPVVQAQPRGRETDAGPGCRAALLPPLPRGDTHLPVKL